MAHTNWGRIIGGGLLAGLVINLIEFVVNGILLMNVWGEAMKALGKPPAFSTFSIVIANIIGFLLGIGGVWLYAAIRPRYCAGVKTAVRAAVAVWFLAYFLPSASLYTMHLFKGRLLALGTAIGLVEIVLALVLGAWIYKEKEEAPAARSAVA